MVYFSTWVILTVYRNGKSHIDGRTEGHGGHGVENVDVKLGRVFLSDWREIFQVIGGLQERKANVEVIREAQGGPCRKSTQTLGPILFFCKPFGAKL